MEPKISTLLGEDNQESSLPHSHTNHNHELTFHHAGGTLSADQATHNSWSQTALQTAKYPTQGHTAPAVQDASLPPPPQCSFPNAPRRLRPIESREDESNDRLTKIPRLREVLEQHLGSTAGGEPQPRVSQKKSGAPIANVLNTSGNSNQHPSSENAPRIPEWNPSGDDGLSAGTAPPSVVAPPPGAASGTGTAPPFSGRLSDILIDPLRDHGASRTVLHGALPQNCSARATSGSGNVDIYHSTSNSNELQRTLPQLPPRVSRKVPKRLRIPPLLQGLHQPPPLPQGRLFPPITGEGHGFGSLSDLQEDLGKERIGHRAKQPAVLPAGVSSTLASRGNHSQESLKPTEHLTLVPATADGSDQLHAHVSDSESLRANRKPQKRQRWTDEETKHLLQGVDMFGVGNWKKILNHPEFSFHKRNTVDLKDRFRTVCPDGGLKNKKKSRAKPLCAHTHSDVNQGCNAGAEAQVLGHEASAVEQTSNAGLRAKRKPRNDQHRIGVEELARMGIRGAFAKRKRRERQPFTETDDVNLLKGFEKYGCEWARIRDDHELGFGTRQSRDLRDRFRTRFPGKYKEAGRSLGAKDTQISSESKSREDWDEAPRQWATSAPGQHSGTDPSATVTMPSSERTSLRPPYLYSSADSFLRSLEDLDGLSDLLSEDDDATRSPVILSRTILEFKDKGNSASTSMGAPASAHYHYGQSLHQVAGASLRESDIVHNDLEPRNGADTSSSAPRLYNPFMSMPSDSVSADIGSSNNSTVTAKPSCASTQNSTTIHRTLVTDGANSSDQNGKKVNAAMSSLLSQSLPHKTSSMSGTGSGRPGRDSISNKLPTLVFPRVPVRIARNANHNLPRPAELLSSAPREATSRSASVNQHLSVNSVLPKPMQGPKVTMPQNIRHSAVPSSSYRAPEVNLYAMTRAPTESRNPSQPVSACNHVPPAASTQDLEAGYQAYNTAGLHHMADMVSGMKIQIGPTNVPDMDLSHLTMAAPWTGTFPTLQNPYADMRVPYAAPLPSQDLAAPGRAPVPANMRSRQQDLAPATSKAPSEPSIDTAR